jgi:CO/xanthine dehydrogenase Mo-binding subunit
MIEMLNRDLTSREFSRKDLVRGGGLMIVAMSVGAAGVAGKASADPVNINPTVPNSLDSWLAVHSDNTVTVNFGKVEFGQGATTGLRQIAAEELDVSFAQIRAPRPQTGVTVNQGATVGSGSISRGGPQIRAAAAYAKQQLLGLASAQLGVPVASLTVSEGVVSGGGRTITYGQLLGEKVFAYTVPATTLTQGVSPAKSPAAYKLVGARVPRIDIPDKVTGRFTYMHNVRVPGMLHGRVVRPRGQAGYGSGAKPLSVDEGSIKHVAGAQVVRRGDFVGVIAPREYDAIQAAAQLNVKWDAAQTLPGSGEIFKQYRDQDAAGQTVNSIRVSTGDVGAGFAGAAKTISATFKTAYQTHGPLGPNCAVADVRRGSAFVMSPTQSIYDTRYTLGVALGMPESQITVQYWDGGGTFGSSGYDDVTVAAAVMSQLAGKPVRVQFMRWDEHGWDTYGPAQLYDVRAAVDAKGNIVAYDSTQWAHPYVPYLAGQTSRELIGVPIPTQDLSQGSVDTGQGRYTIANRRVTAKKIDVLKGYLQASYLRLPLGPQNNFATEQVIDELAYAAGMDPIAFRRQNWPAADTRGLAVLDAIAEVSGWKPGVAASSLDEADVVTGRGMATTGNQAVVADIQMRKSTGKIVATHLFAVQDAGLAVNPALIENQIEGSLVQTASRALNEAVKFNRTRVTSLDWVSYPIMRFQDTPKVTAVVINRPDIAAAGAGEATCGPVFAAIANAFFDATGVRIRQAPMTPAVVRATLKAAGVA